MIINFKYYAIHVFINIGLIIIWKAGMATSYKGHTWGKVDFSETALKMCTMDENPKSIFNVEFESINNATINKNDIILETGAKI